MIETRTRMGTNYRQPTWPPAAVRTASGAHDYSQVRFAGQVVLLLTDLSDPAGCQIAGTACLSSNRRGPET